MLINVTQNDITHGRKGNGEECPVALALRRTTGHEVINVGSYNRVWIIVGPKPYEMPTIVREFTRNFDAGNLVEPFTFDLPIQLEGNLDKEI